MTYRSPITIGEINFYGPSQESFAIEVWPGYGVVCSRLGSHNGSIPAVARHLCHLLESQSRIRSELNDPSYGVQLVIGGMAFDGMDSEAVAIALHSLCVPHMAASA